MKIKEYINMVKKLKDEYSDEIPKKIVHSVDSPKYKCRKGWFASLYGLIEIGIDLGYIDNISKNMFLNLIEYMDKTNFNDRLTKKEDIEKANAVLTNIIETIKIKAEEK